MKNTLLYLCMLLLFLSIEACKKKDDPKPSQTTTSLLKIWKVAKVSQTGLSTPLYQNPLPTGQPNTEDYSRYQLTFSTTSDYSLTEKDGSIRTGKWELASNDTKLVLDKGVQGKELTTDIVHATSTLLHLRYSENSTKTGTRELLIELIPQ